MHVQGGSRGDGVPPRATYVGLGRRNLPEVAEPFISLLCCIRDGYFQWLLVCFVIFLMAGHLELCHVYAILIGRRDHGFLGHLQWGGRVGGCRYAAGL